MTDADRIEATTRTLLAACREAGAFVSGDQRVTEDTAAALLGFKPATLAGWRCEGTGPAAYRLGGNGHRVTYRIGDLAAWIESTLI